MEAKDNLSNLFRQFGELILDERTRVSTPSRTTLYKPDPMPAPQDSILGKPNIFFFKIRDNPDTALQDLKYLLIAASKDNSYSMETAMSIFVNIICYAFQNYIQDFKTSITNSGMDVVDQDTSLLKFLGEAGVTIEDLATLDDYDFGHDHAKAMIGMYFNLITKKLTNNNITGWYRGRKIAYSQATSIIDDQNIFDIIRPDVSFAEKINTGMRTLFRLKREIFISVRDTSQSNTHDFYEVCKVTMVYYSMAELTSYSIVYNWIILRNPILLGWSGLSKYLPSLINAIRKFRSFGKDAPYCKLLYPEDQLQEFTRDKIGIFTQLALEIAIKEGHSSFANYQSITVSDEVSTLIRRAMRILDIVSGANTRSTAIIRNMTLENPTH